MMPGSLSDFRSQIAAHVGASGAVFRTVANPDGSVQILRAPNAISGIWSVLHARVIHNFTTDVVAVSDGTGGHMVGTGAASVFIAGLN
jgi:hypothetical protein